MDDHGASVWNWMHVVRRARLGRTVKGLAAVLASYADPNGTRVFPGVARFAVEAEVEYKTAQEALSRLRRVGLIELVRRAGRRGQHDEYRLILHADLLERVEVLSPVQVEVAAAKVRRPRGNKPRAPERQPAARGDVDVDDGPEAVSRQPGSVDDRVEEEVRPVVTSAHGTPISTATSARATRHVSPSDGAPPIDPATTVTPGITNPSVVDQQAHVATARASRRCPHGNSPRRRRNGAPRCPACEQEVSAA